MIHIVPILRDNYCYLLEGTDKECLILDPGDAEPVAQYIEKNALKPVLILNTHHHDDHIAGNAALKQRYGISVIGPQAEAQSIPSMDQGVHEGDIISQSGITLFIIETPGHTLGHIVFYWKDRAALFSGDTMFSMGCGRLFEGTAEDMYNSFHKLKALPDDTNLYCGHEYTQSNGTFALSIDPDNVDLTSRMTEVNKLRANNQPTLPVTFATERKTNPFLRADTLNEFAGLRARKDNF